MKQNIKHIVDSVKELNDPTILFMLLFGVTSSYVAWMVIAVYELGLQFNHILWGQVFAVGGLLILFGIACRFDISHVKWIERLLLLLPAAGFSILAVFDFKFAFTFLAMFMITFSVKVIRVCNYAAALPNIQNGESKNTKLALVMLLLPIIQALSYVFLGVLAEIDIKVALSFMAASFIGLFIYLVHKGKYMHILPKSIKFPVKVPLKTKLILLADVICSAPYYVVLLVVVPLYLYDKTNANFGFIGVILSFMCLVSIISKGVQKSAEHSHINTVNISIYSLLAVAGAFIIWSFADSLLLVTVMLVIYNLSQRMLSFGILSELEISDPYHYAQYTKVKELYQHGAGLIVFAICALFANDITLHVGPILITFAFAYIVAAGVMFLAKNLDNS